MPTLLIPLLLALAGGAAAVYASKHTPSPSPKADGAALLPDTWYRVSAKADPAVVAAVRKNAPDGASQTTLTNRFRAAIERVGFTGTKLVLQDPITADNWLFITKWDHPATSALPALDGLTLTRVEPVEAPPSADAKPEPPPSLDAGIPYDEAHAVAYALAKDNDPVHLRNFGNTMLPDYPVAASLLQAKAKLGEAISKGGAKTSGTASPATIPPDVTIPPFVRFPVFTLSVVSKGLGTSVQQGWRRYQNAFQGAAVPPTYVWQSQQSAKANIPDATLFSLTRGNSAEEKGKSFAQATEEAKARGVPVKTVLTEHLVKAVSQIDKTKLDREVRPLLSKVLKDERLEMFYPADLAKAAKVSEAAAWAALATVKRLPQGISLVDADLFRKVLPAGPGPVPTSALALMATLRKPGQGWPGLAPDIEERAVIASASPAGTRTGDVFDTISDVATSAVDKLHSAVSDMGDFVTHPADDVTAITHALTHPADSIHDFVQASIDTIHIIPGMDQLGDLLKDFANTDVGKWCFRVMATYGYYVAAPYLGAQLASISFALPGVVQAKPAVQSWIQETLDRAIKTATILVGTKIEGSPVSDEVNQFLAQNPQIANVVNKLTGEIGKGVQTLKDKFGTGFSAVQKLAASYGVPPNFEKMANDLGVRMDSAAAIYDLLTGSHFQSTTAWDPQSGLSRDVYLARLQASKLRAPSQATPISATSVRQQARFSATNTQKRLNVAKTRVQAATSAAKAGDPKGKAAAYQLYRADQMLGRRKWIEHYRRIEAAEKESMTSSGGGRRFMALG